MKKRTCIIKAKGCKITFIPKCYKSFTCSNKECIRIRTNKAKKKYQLKIRTTYKMYNKVKSTRTCLGVNCRGEKMFRSINGERLCHFCKESISGMESPYQDTIIAISNKGTRNL